MSVHSLSCFPVAFYGTDDAAQAVGCPTCSGASCSARTACPSRTPGPTPRRLTTRRSATAISYVVDGTKAWITHGGVADFYELMVRTGEPGPRGISCLLADATTPGLSAAPPENKMGAWSSPTAQIRLESAPGSTPTA